MTGLPHVRRSFNSGSVSLLDQKEGGRGNGCQFHSPQRTSRGLDVSWRVCILFQAGGSGLSLQKEIILSTPCRRELEGAELEPEQSAGVARRVFFEPRELDQHQVSRR